MQAHTVKRRNPNYSDFGASTCLQLPDVRILNSCLITKCQNKSNQRDHYIESIQIIVIWFISPKSCLKTELACIQISAVHCIYKRQFFDNSDVPGSKFCWLFLLFYFKPSYANPLFSLCMIFKKTNH